jgi:hypothetical protein
MADVTLTLFNVLYSGRHLGWNYSTRTENSLYNICHNFYKVNIIM